MTRLLARILLMPFVGALLFIYAYLRADAAYRDWEARR